MPNTVIYANLLPFIEIFFVIFFVQINPLFDKKQNKMFFLSAVTILFMLVVISVDYTVSLSSYKYAWLIRRITSFFHFSFSCLVPIFLICIFTHEKLNRLMYLPVAANMVICAMSMFVNLVFYFPYDGSYVRGPMFLFPSIITIFYIVFLLIVSAKERHQRSHEALFLVGVIVGLAFSMYLEVVERFKFLSWDFAATFLILYYLLLNINKSKFDPLTGAYNRAVYVRKTETLNRSHCCLIAMIDINGFKAINDEKGHEEGDRLLIQFVTTSQSFMDQKNVLYRIGGDEFAILSEETSEEKFKKRIDSFFNKLSEFGINCAVGVVKYDPAIDIESTIRVADMKMYEDKRRYYSDKTQI